MIFQFPKLGELLLKRLVVQFRRGFKRNDKTICITAATFIAHLVNQEVVRTFERILQSYPKQLNTLNCTIRACRDSVW